MYGGRRRTTAGLGGLAALVGFACAGCGSLGGDDASFDGALGQGKFEYVCIDATDPACAVSSDVASDGAASTAGATSAGETAATAPQAIAVGSSFRLLYGGGTSFSSSVNVGSPVVRAVSSEFLAPAASGPSDFHVLAAGYAAVYLVSTVDSDFIDYMLLHLVTVDALRIGSSGGVSLPSSFAMSGAAPTAFTVTPLADGVAAAGALDFQWSVDDSTLLDLTEANPTARMTVAPKGKAGTAMLTVTGAGLQASISLEVSP